VPCPHKPRMLGGSDPGSGPDLSPVPKNRKHGCRPWWPLPSQWGSSGSVRGVREIWGPPHPPHTPYPQEAERGVNSRLRPDLTLDKPRIEGGSGPDLEARAPHGGTRADPDPKSALLLKLHFPEVAPGAHNARGIQRTDRVKAKNHRPKRDSRW
jgi:hypothetical protein